LALVGSSEQSIRLGAISAASTAAASVLETAGLLGVDLPIFAMAMWPWRGCFLPRAAEGDDPRGGPE
jgi:hypothetical protein